MQKRLMDILADPDDPNIWPLKLKVFKSEMRDRETMPQVHSSTKRLCKFYCYYKNEYLVSDPLGEEEKSLPLENIELLVSLDDCKNCFSEEIIDGIIFHEEKELKWFIIDDEIPVMFPLELRDIKQEEKFIKNFSDECKEMGINKPFNK